MGKWQITGLANGWVIMGSGYAGEIKQGTAVNSWCYPNDPINEIPTLSPVKVSPGSQSQIEWDLVNQKEGFIKPLSYLAHTMGFAWVGGNRSSYVGDDMEVTKTGSGWKIQGYNGGSCDGYRCDEKSAAPRLGLFYSIEPTFIPNPKIITALIMAINVIWPRNSFSLRSDIF